MSIDFTGVKGIADDYGNVKQITDASGRVLWSAGKPVTITLKRKSGMYQNPENPHGWIVVNGQTYYAEETPTEIPVKVGTTITCCNTAGVQVNGQYVSNGGVDYEYTVNSEIIIEIVSTHVSDTQYLGIILITEIPEGHALVTIKPHSTIIGSNSSYAKVTINDVEYSGNQETALALPVGTTIACYVNASISSYQVYDKDGNTKATNGINEKGTFNYEVVGNATIEVGAKNQQYVGWQAGIIITEQ